MNRSLHALACLALLTSVSAFAQTTQAPMVPRYVEPVDRGGPRPLNGADLNKDPHGWPVEAGGACSKMKTAKVVDTAGKPLGMVYAWRCGAERHWIGVDMVFNPTTYAKPAEMLMELKRLEVIQSNGFNPSQYKEQGEALVSSL